MCMALHSVGSENDTEYEEASPRKVEKEADFPLTLARWPMASEHWRQTSDILSYWPRLPSGISTIAKNFKKKKN